MYTQKYIIDKIIKESDINPLDYTVADRIDDVNEEYLFRIEQSVQIGSTIPMSESETTTEEFTVAIGSNTFTRTIKDVAILRVDFQDQSTGDFCPVKKDESRSVEGFDDCEMTYFANDKQIFVEEGDVGTLRITYGRGDVALFTQAQYDLGDNGAGAPLFPDVIVPLLWLIPALKMAKIYKPKRVTYLQDQIDKFEVLFFNKYSRDSSTTMEFVTEEVGNNR